MKAIVLTLDKNHALTDLMIRKYNKNWPEHPFAFRVPYQNSTKKISKTNRTCCEFIRTPPAICDTVINLLEGIPDDEFVYWAIDDKLPIYINTTSANEIISAIRSGNSNGLDGVLFCRDRRLLKDEFLDRKNTKLLGSIRVIGRVDWSQIWLHQFVRAGILRDFFRRLSEIRFQNAKNLDEIKWGVSFPADANLYVTAESHAIFLESMEGGAITHRAAIEMLREKKILGFMRKMVLRNTVLGKGNLKVNS